MAARLFIASSSEGLHVARVVRSLLQSRLKRLVDIRVWNGGTFKLSSTYIESLAREVKAADFAVMVMTRDDQIVTRRRAGFAPRDNVVFELGLFTGELGRERVFFISPRGLKLPSDLTGVHAPQFVRERGKGWRATLAPACSLIEIAIREGLARLPSRPKLTEDEHAAQDEVRRFCDRVRGAWWEWIFHDGRIHSLSFFTIEIEETYSSIRLDGRAYDATGKLRAYWNSAGARLQGSNLAYVRQCKHYLPGVSPRWKPGLGVIDFHRARLNRPIEEGFGEFWEGDADDPTKTVIKGTTIFRVSNRRDVRVMTAGSDQQKKRLVKTLMKRRTQLA